MTIIFFLSGWIYNVFKITISKSIFFFLNKHELT